MERFNLKNLNEVKGKEKYHIQASNRFAASKDLDAELEINSSWEMIERISKFQLKRV
jgi:2-oxo-4-hydroxy-4-carboxy--5-ureidoimidazoline (OHCU) decarboxylase